MFGDLYPVLGAIDSIVEGENDHVSYLDSAIYSELDFNDHREIRLMKIFRRQGESIACQLWTANLDEKPQYCAVSYTWGPSTNEEAERGVTNEPTHRIFCNSHALLITENLYNFLVRAAENPDLASRSMWIDILCIDQHNDSERAEQVELMASIYESANFVLAWLGEEDKSTERSFGLIKHLASLSDDELKSITPGRLACENALHLLGPCGGISSWNSLARFLQRNYFNRVWIIQEITLAKVRLAICGKHKIPWDYIVKVSKFLMISSWTRCFSPGGVFAAVVSHPSKHALPNLVEANRRTIAKDESKALLYTLIRARRFVASDPRDKIYALLGVIAKSTSGKNKLSPVYGKRSVAETYTLAAIQILKDSDDLLLLLQAEGDAFRTIDALPSWVPDWSCSRTVGLGVTGYTRFSASGNVPRSLCIDEKSKTLAVMGTKLDDIVMNSESKQDLLLRKPFPRLLAMICALPLPYHTSQPPLEVLWRSLITDTAGEEKAHPAPPAYGNAFLSWFHTRLDEIAQHVDKSLLSKVHKILSQDVDSLGKIVLQDAHQDMTEAEEYETVFSHSPNLRPFLTRNLFFGIGSESLHEQDSIWIIAGSRIPLILRAAGSRTYEIVGGSYVHGFMGGQALKLCKPFEAIELI
ncbi:HET-domain-containing protein [Viridothelium virens]|uniref:HET-domain-containing protein n=1 Tax=Viridothelium virens TaxID=1048519 RepID=A0A6A6HDN4_VIRVR|nr:HET-domain-containing protein [Viridothelium virens]